MADQLAPTEALIELLHDVDNGKVRENSHNLRAYLYDLGDGEPPADVADMVWAMERAGWVKQPADSPRFCVTDRGREVLDRGAP